MAEILIVEDETILALNLEMFLKKLGHNVIGIVTSGEEAIVKVKDIPPDLVLMDIRLNGEMDGIETANKIHRVYDIPVIYITAFSDEETLNRAKITEPLGYIIKPFDERDLHGCITMALYRHKMENKLRENEERFRSIFEPSSDGLILIDETGIIVEWNKENEEIIGYNAKEVIGQSYMDYQYRLLLENRITSDEFDYIKSTFRNYLRTGTAPWLNQNVEIRRLHPEGSFHHFNQVAFSIPSEKGFRLGINTRDTTEQKDFEDKLKLNEVRLESLLSLHKMTDVSLDKIIEYCFEEGVRLTQSKIGYLAMISQDQTQITIAKSKTGRPFIQ